MNLNINQLVSREDVINLALQYSLKNYEDSDSKLVKNLKETEFSLNKLREKGKLREVINDGEKDKNYIILYARSYISNGELYLPTRGKPCVHSECINFNELFEYVAIHK
jgi:hypothetical protein